MGCHKYKINRRLHYRYRTYLVYKRNGPRKNSDWLYQCPHQILGTRCEYKHRKPFQLNRHYVTHTGEKSFQCKFCQKKFTKRIYCIPHVQVHIGNLNVRLNALQCTVCDLRFLKNTEVINHTLDEHGGIIFAPCVL